MDVSVVICTYALDRYEDFSEAVESVLEQSYDSVEVIVVVDGNETVAERVRTDFADEDIVVYNNDENRGVSYSRTKGAEIATGEVVAFIDDDAVADPNWVSELVRGYEEMDALAVGGRMAGNWLAGRPWFLPAEFDWLVGVTHRGFTTETEEVRNTFESNISFRRETFLGLGGFDPELGPKADEYRNSEGSEIGSRLQSEYGRGVLYVPTAVVTHKVFDYRTHFVWLARRAFKQGVSKRTMEQRTVADSSEEFGFLYQLFTEHLPRRVGELIRNPSVERVGQLLMLFVFTGLVGIGYMYSTIRYFVSR